MKKRSIIVALAMCLCLCSCAESEPVLVETPPVGDASTSVSEVLDAEEPEEEEQEPALFEERHINELLENYNAIAEYKIPPEKIEKGNIKTKANIYFEEMDIEIVYSSDGFVSVNICDRQEPDETMYPIFRDFVIAVNSELTEDDVKQAWSDIQNEFFEIDYGNTGNRNTYELGGMQIAYIGGESSYQRNADIRYETDAESPYSFLIDADSSS